MADHARSDKFGLPPGSLVFVGEKKQAHSQITVMDFDEQSFEYREAEVTVNDLEPYLARKSVSWINIYGLHDTELIGEIGRLLKLHPLVLEDILNTKQRPKVEPEPKDGNHRIVGDSPYDD